MVCTLLKPEGEKVAQKALLLTGRVFVNKELFS